jgi:hypothetical protein
MLRFLWCWLIPSQRQKIFHFHDGSRWRRADPLVIEAAFDSACPGWEDYLKVLSAPDAPFPGGVLKDQQEGKKIAKDMIVEATRKAFGCRPLDDEGGLTEASTIALFTDFLVQMGKWAELARPTSAS